jgi:transposase InsO family protein
MKESRLIIERNVDIMDLRQALMTIAEIYRSLKLNLRDPAEFIKILQEESLSDLVSRTRAAARNPRSRVRLPKDIECRVLEYTTKFPHHGQDRVSRELKKLGISISPGSVRGIWLKHRLEKKQQRIKLGEGLNTVRPDEESNKVEEPMVMTFPEQAVHPAQEFLQDTYFVGHVRGVGKVYHQLGIDFYSGFAFVKLYQDRTSLSAADLLNDRVLPFLDRCGLKMGRVWTDTGVEFCGVSDSHAYQIFLKISGIEHQKAMPPQGRKAIESLNRVLQKTFYDIALRRKSYATLQDIQADLDVFMERYNSTPQDSGTSPQDLAPRQRISNAT